MDNQYYRTCTLYIYYYVLGSVQYSTKVFLVGAIGYIMLELRCQILKDFV